MLLHIDGGHDPGGGGNRQVTQVRLLIFTNRGSDVASY